MTQPMIQTLTDHTLPLEEALAMSDAAWIYEGGFNEPPRVLPPLVARAHSDDARVAAKVARCELALPGLRAAWSEHNETRRLAAAAANRERQEIASAAGGRLLDWARLLPGEVGEQARAGYAFESKLFRSLGFEFFNRLCKADGYCSSVEEGESFVVQEGDDGGWLRFEWELRRSPSLRAMRLHSYAEVELQAMRASSLPPETTAELLMVQRVTERQRSKTLDRFTAIVLLLKHPAVRTTAVIYPTE